MSERSPIELARSVMANKALSLHLSAAETHAICTALIELHEAAWPIGGQLGFFRWWQDGPRTPPAEPARWMRTWGRAALTGAPPELFGPPVAESPLSRMMRKATRP